MGIGCASDVLVAVIIARPHRRLPVAPHFFRRGFRRRELLRGGEGGAAPGAVPRGGSREHGRVRLARYVKNIREGTFRGMNRENERNVVLVRDTRFIRWM